MLLEPPDGLRSTTDPEIPRHGPDASEHDGRTLSGRSPLRSASKRDHNGRMTSTSTAAASRPSLPRTIGRIALGAVLVFAGTTHLTIAREEFQAQVPPWLPLDKDFVVIASGVVEISLGAALLLARRRRVPVGWIVAAFFVAIFPGNIAQYVGRVDGFGLTTDTARALRLPFQPLLVLWALWSTGAWKNFRERRRSAR